MKKLFTKVFILLASVATLAMAVAESGYGGGG